MSYAVDWTPEARSQLAALWVLHASFRNAITAAQAHIDQRLAADPRGNGHPLSEGLHAIDVLPLRALYEIEEADRFILVVSVSWLV